MQGTSINSASASYAGVCSSTGLWGKAGKVQNKVVQVVECEDSDRGYWGTTALSNRSGTRTPCELVE